MRLRGISLIRPGDLIGFSGCNWKSSLIRIGTCGWICCGGLSHVGIAVAWSGHQRPLLCESTSLGEFPCVAQGKLVAGVQLHYLRQRIVTYHGMVWHYPLAVPLVSEESDALAAFARQHLGRPYDLRGAFAARHTPLAWLVRPAEDLAELYCSESCAVGLRHVGRLATDNASAWSPNGLARHLVRQGICKKPRRIK